MGDSANYVNEGYICQSCFELIDGDNPGHPRNCEDCAWIYERR